MVIERLTALPAKPQNVIVERWLPYSERGNVVVQWEEPRVSIRWEVKYLGVIRANPAEYVQRYASELKTHAAPLSSSRTLQLQVKLDNWPGTTEAQEELGSSKVTF